MLQRTNIYLDEDKLRALKQMAAEREQSVATLVRKAVDEFLDHEFANDADWQHRIESLVQRVRQRTPDIAFTDDIEHDISLARRGSANGAPCSAQ